MPSRTNEACPGGTHSLSARPSPMPLRESDARDGYVGRLSALESRTALGLSRGSTTLEYVGSLTVRLWITASKEWPAAARSTAPSVVLPCNSATAPAPVAAATTISSATHRGLIPRTDGCCVATVAIFGLLVSGPPCESRSTPASGGGVESPHEIH